MSHINWQNHVAHQSSDHTRRPGCARDGVPATADAAELAEMLQFLSQWLDRDPACLGASLEELVGNPAYGLQDLHADLERFAVLLGGSDGEPLFGPQRQSPPRANPSGAESGPAGLQ